MWYKTINVNYEWVRKISGRWQRISHRNSKLPGTHPVRDIHDRKSYSRPWQSLQFWTYHSPSSSTIYLLLVVFGIFDISGSSSCLLHLLETKFIRDDLHARAISQGLLFYCVSVVYNIMRTEHVYSIFTLTCNVLGPIPTRWSWELCVLELVK